MAQYRGPMRITQVLALSTVTALHGCSLSNLDRVDCESNQVCQDAFGYGAQCGVEGYCDVAELPARCELSDPTLTLPLSADDHFLIGTLFDHSLDTHIGRFQSAQLAATQANANGGLGSSSFVMLHCSNQEDASFDALTKDEASLEMAHFIADAGVKAIVGPASSSRAEAAYNAVAEAQDVLLISPSATSPTLTAMDGLTSTDQDPGLFWRTAPPDDLQGRAIAVDMRTNFGGTEYRTLASDHVAVIYQTGAYGEGLQIAFGETFVEEGGTFEGFPFANDGQRADAIANAANGSFDEVLFVSSDSDDTVAFLQGAASLTGLSTLPLFLSDGARNTDVLVGAVSASAVFSHVRGTAPSTPAGAIYDSYAVAYASEYGGGDVSSLSFVAQSYDASWLVIYAHAYAQSDGDYGGTSLGRGLRKVSSGTPLDLRPTSWNEAKSRLADGESVDVTGASGKLNYDPLTGETSAVIEVWTINGSGDGFEAVATFEP